MKQKKRPKEKHFKTARENRFTTCTRTEQMNTDFCKQYKSEDNGKTSLQYRKKKTVNLEFPVKIYFKNEGKMKPFSGMQKLK